MCDDISHDKELIVVIDLRKFIPMIPIRMINKISGLLLILFSVTVAIPLVIKTIQTSGGTWGFGVIGLGILIPLSACILFGVAALMMDEKIQWKIFIAAHGITITTGIAGLFIFPVYPQFLAIVPGILAMISVFDRNNFRYYLFAMIALALLANILLLKWEIEFGRVLPLLQLFDSSDAIPLD